ncbi:MAG: SNF2-related protein [Vulcanisaeta sp.]
MVSLIELLRSAGKDLYKHQLDFVSDVIWMERPRLLLADDVGLGKTIQALLLIRVLMEFGRVNHVLVIVPRAVLEQWSTEMENFEIPHYIVESPDFPIGHRVYLITLDRAKMPNYMDSLDKLQWDLVVIDEAHKIRLGTQRERLSHLCMRAGGCLLLTATPHTGDDEDYRFLTGLVGGVVVRREKKDVEEYEDRKIFPTLKYWIVQVKASRDESIALSSILNILKNRNIEPIVRVVVEKRAMSSPASLLKTLGKVVGGTCDEETLEEGELDACLGNIAGWREIEELASKYVGAADRKLEALRRLIGDKLRGRKILVFTEYATTAEYLFQSLTKDCKIIESGDGYASADCGEVGVMYATSKARGRIDISTAAFLLAQKYSTAVLISTDIMSEGVNLQVFNVVVNYEVVWSPTKHIQRVGRIWRFGQRADNVLVMDMVLKTNLERDEYTMYLDLLEKLYAISLRALPPQSYGEFEIYEVGEEGIRKIINIGSSIFLRGPDVYETIISRRLEELRSKIEAILREKEKIRWKPKSLVDEGLRVKLGYPYKTAIEAGGGYYIVDITYVIGKQGLTAYKEKILMRLPTPLSRSRNVQEVLVREGGVDWDSVEEESGDIKEDERDLIFRKVQLELWMYLKKHLDVLAKYLPIENPSYKITLIRRARVIRSGVIPAGGFESFVWDEVRRSINRERTELAAARCVEDWLKKNGYVIKEGYRSTPRPFDLVVEKNGTLYTVEVKGKWIMRKDEPLSFTANEIDWASKFADRHLICIAYVDNDKCEDLECVTFIEFQRKWVLETVRGIEYKYNARKAS